MAFDAGMLNFVLKEINEKLQGGRVDKIYQPAKDETVFLFRAGGKDLRLLINAGSSYPRMNITEIKSENPAVPPMFCMALRKHFSGGKFVSVEQFGFDRAAKISLECKDDMGFKTEKHVIIEIMGKYSNIVMTDAEDKIIGVLKPIDFSASQIRQLLPGMKYTLPPSQNKNDPTATTEEEFEKLLNDADSSSAADKFIMKNFCGISSLVAREIVYRASGNAASSIWECGENLKKEFFSVMDVIKSSSPKPTIVVDENGTPIDYSFINLSQYSGKCSLIQKDSIGALIDEYYMEKAREERLRRKASDVFRILSNADARINKKITLQTEELDKCENGDKYRLWADLITANIYALKRGMKRASLSNYFSEGEAIDIPLNERFSPAQNAQFYYKKYNKSKTAKIHLTKQLELAKLEMDYINSVFDMLSRAETENELSEIRAELYHSGYASKMKNYVEKKKSVPLFMKFNTTDGHIALCGKNNNSNDYLTTKAAKKNDLWFHVKDYPGSHVVLQVNDGEDEISDETILEVAMIAAYYSKLSDSSQIPVDYTRIKQVKKPAGAKPGYVIYNTNRTKYVTPDIDKINSMRVK